VRLGHSDTKIIQILLLPIDSVILVHAVEKIVYDTRTSFISHFVVRTPPWHSPQVCRALNPYVLQNASYKTCIIICYFEI
jgi:hypothetical protein